MTFRMSRLVFFWMERARIISSIDRFEIDPDHIEFGRRDGIVRFSIYCRDDNYSRHLQTEIRNTLEQKYHDVYDWEEPELVCCIGGDGTILRAIHHYEKQLDSVCFVGIHTGTLGFFTDYTKDQVWQFIDELHQNKSTIESYSLIEAKLDDGRSFLALNEIRLGSFINTVRFDIYVDNEYFETVCSAGICVSTQAGSTAANRSLGGAVIDEGLRVLELTQIMPVSHINQHSLTVPYVLKQERVITVMGKSLESSVLCYDHLETQKLEGIKKVIIRLSDRKVNFIRFHPYSYLKRLKNLF